MEWECEYCFKIFASYRAAVAHEADVHPRDVAITKVQTWWRAICDERCTHQWFIV